MNSRNVLLNVEHLKKYFAVKSKRGTKGTLKAVDDVSFDLAEGEVLGLVGESGCGKSTLGRTILRLYSVTGGEIKFEGKNIEKLGVKAMRPLRKDMQMVFQDPYASLNPRMTIGAILREPLDVFKIGKKEERDGMVLAMLEKIGLSSEYLYKMPHEMSGGQRQRVGIARAMISNPKFVVCDEPVSALDVSVRAQVLNLMKDIQMDNNTAYLFISHDLSTVRYICDRIAVMYLGKIVEIAPADELFEHPVHPYTKILLAAIPVPEVGAKRERIILTGDVPSPIDPPKGCAFHTRCPYAIAACAETVPSMEAVGENGHFVSCINKQTV